MSNSNLTFLSISKLSIYQHERSIYLLTWAQWIFQFVEARHFNAIHIFSEIAQQTIELCEKFSLSKNESLLKFYKRRKTRFQKKDLIEWSSEWINKFKSILSAVEDFERDIDKWQNEFSEYNIIDEEVSFNS